MHRTNKLIGLMDSQIQLRYRITVSEWTDKLGDYRTLWANRLSDLPEEWTGELLCLGDVFSAREHICYSAIC